MLRIVGRSIIFGKEGMNIEHNKWIKWIRLIFSLDRFNARSTDGEDRLVQRNDKFQVNPLERSGLRELGGRH